jgi:hypothetical protein
MTTLSSLVSSLTLSGSPAGTLGTSMSVSADSKKFVVGSADAMYVYTRPSATSDQYAMIASVANSYASADGDVVVAMSPDGDTVAVSFEGESQDTVKIYSLSIANDGSGTLTLQQTYTGSPGFGNSLSFSYDGNVLVVGSPQESLTNAQNESVEDSGFVKVYTRSDKVVSPTWSLTRTINNPNLGVEDYFGYDVSVSDNASRLAIGSIGETNTSNVKTGAVYIYNMTASSHSLAHKAMADDCKAGTCFGSSVSISRDGKKVAIGAFGMDDNQTQTVADENAALVIYSESSGAWSVNANMLKLGNSNECYFVNDVDMSYDGDSVAVSYQSELTTNSSTSTSVVSIFDYDGSQWVESNKIGPSQGYSNSWGSAIAYSSQPAVLFASDTLYSGTGQVKILSVSGVTDSSGPYVGSISVVSSSMTSIEVEWSTATDNYSTSADIQYALYYSTSDNIGTVANIESNGTLIRAYQNSPRSYTLSNLSPGTAYYFNVIAKDADGNKSTYSVLSQATVADTTSPTIGSPSTITVSSIGDSSLTLSWNKSTDNYDVQSALTYKVYRASTDVFSSVSQAESSGTLIATDTNINTYAVTGLSPATAYYFNVVVADSFGNKSLYTTATVTTAADSTAPSPGSSGTVTLSGATVSSMSVSWSAASDNITSASSLQYALYYSTSNNIGTVANIESNGVKVMDYTANTTSFNATNLNAATTYYFNVIVKDSAGNKSAYSAAYLITQPDLVAPVPGNSGTISIGSITKSSMVLTWSKATDNYTAQSGLRYEIRRSTSNNIGTVSTFKSGTIVRAFAPDLSTVTVENLLPNTQYYFNVIVMDAFGNRAVYSMANSTTLVDNSGPTPGNSGTITFSGTTMQETMISWARASDEATHYEDLEYALYYSTSNNIGTVANIESNGTLLMDYELDTVSFPMTDLDPGTTYYFNVIVKDEQGNKSAYSTGNVTTVADTTAPVPGNSGVILSDSATTSSVHLSWTAAEDDVTDTASIMYAAYRSLSNNISTVANAESNGTLIMNWTANTTELNVTGLNSSSTYYFNVLAKDAAGNKVPYTQAKVSTIVDTSAPSPGNSGILSASLATASSMHITWTKGDDNVTDSGYLMYGVYYSTSSNIGTVANIESNGTLARTFARDISFLNVTGLEPNQQYYFNVIVKDSAGNKSCYISVSESTLEDIDPPVAGGSGTISASNIGTNSMILSWNKAVDNASVPPNLLYQVRMSTSDNIDTVANAEANGTIVRAYSALTYTTVTGLNSGDTYYFNVIVKDAKGNKSLYVTKQQKTKNDVVEVPSVPVAINDPVVIESSSDKIKILPQVSSHPTLSKPRNWAKVHIIYKSTTTAKRVVVSITNLADMVGTFKAKNAEIFAVHKVIVEDLNNNFVTVPSSAIANASSWNIEVD